MAQHQFPTGRPPSRVPPPQTFPSDTEPPPTTITIALLHAADTSNPDSYYAGLLDAMNDHARHYEVDTPLRVAHFLAQIGHESSFRAVEENGNFSAKRMHQVFGCKGGSKNYDAAHDDCRLGTDGQPMRLRAKLWTDQATYVNNPQRLLSYCYANRLGNSDEDSGDGFRYRGRGLVQLTGKDNYAAFTRAHNAHDGTDPRDFVMFPDLLVSDIRYAIESAFYFWDTGRVNVAADADDLEKVTLEVNGGLNGLEDRRARLARIKNVLGI